MLLLCTKEPEPPYSDIEFAIFSHTSLPPVTLRSSIFFLQARNIPSIRRTATSCYLINIQNSSFILTLEMVDRSLLNRHDLFNTAREAGNLYAPEMRFFLRQHLTCYNCEIFQILKLARVSISTTETGSFKRKRCTIGKDSPRTDTIPWIKLFSNYLQHGNCANQDNCSLLFLTSFS